MTPAAERAEAVAFLRGLLAVVALWLIAVGLVQTVIAARPTVLPALLVGAGGWLLVIVRRGVDR